MFADDIVLVAETEEDLQCMHTQCTEFKITPGVNVVYSASMLAKVVHFRQLSPRLEPLLNSNVSFQK